MPHLALVLGQGIAHWGRAEQGAAKVCVWEEMKGASNTSSFFSQVAPEQELAGFCLYRVAFSREVTKDNEYRNWEQPLMTW